MRGPRAIRRVPGSFGRSALAAVLLVLVAACGGSGPISVERTASPAAASLATPTGTTGSGATLADALAHRITPDGLRVHLAALDAIARANDGDREVGTAGYDATVDYVADVLATAGYPVARQRFMAATWHDPGGSILAVAGDDGRAFRDGEDFRAFAFSPARDVTGRLVSIPDPCVTGAFAGDLRDAVVIAGAGTCPWFPTAFRAGVSAVVVDSGEPSGEVPKAAVDPDGTPVPVLLASSETAAALHAAGRRPSTAGVRVHVRVTGSGRTVPTENVIAELPGSDPAKVLVVGAHLDSVDGAPGLDDDGSGVAAVLEIARLLAGSRPRMTIRFALFSAEELGMRGADHYVASLTEEERGRIEGYLNADMLGAPNGVRGVYVGPRMVRHEQALLGRLVGYLRGAGLPFEVVHAVGATDALPFNEAGIPIAGVISLADEPKTAALAATYGGRAGPMDPCYHLACDDLANVDLQRTAELAAALGWATADLAWSDAEASPSPTP